MANTKPVLITDDPFSSYAKSVSDAVNERTIIAGTDVLVTKGSRGTSFNIHPKYKYNPNYLNYVGDWNLSSSYSPNDVVSVFDIKLGSDQEATPKELLEAQLNAFFTNGFTEITDPNDSSITLYKGTWTAPSTHKYTVYIRKPNEPPKPGVYVCVAGVPDLSYQYALADAKVLTSIGTDPTKLGNLLPFVRFVDFDYFPRFPEPSATAVLDTSDMTKAKGAYWRYIGNFPGDGGSGCQCRYH